MTDHEQKMGFAGLDGLLSDVEKGLRDAERDSQHQTSSQTRSQGKAARPDAETKPAPPDNASRPIFPPPDETAGSTGKIWLGIAGFVIFVIWIASLDESGHGTSNSTSSSYSASRDAQTAPTPPSLAVPPTGTNHIHSSEEIRYCLAADIRIEELRRYSNSNDQIAFFNSIVSDYNSRCGSYRYREGALERARRDIEPYRSAIIANAWDGLSLISNTAQQHVSDRALTNAKLVEERPPADMNAALTIEQARYCVFWRARIQHMEKLAVHEPLLDPLQDYYDSYNSQCVKRRLDQHYERVRSEVEERRDQIEREATNIVGSWKPTYLAPVVASIQEDLNYLGYDAGPVDGLYGKRTRDALLSAQRDAGIAEDGRITYTIRDTLHEAANFARKEQRQADVSEQQEPSNGPRIWFGLVNGTSVEDLQLIQSSSVPNVPGQNYGWFIWVGDSQQEVLWKEVYSAPEAPLSWGVEENPPHVVFSEDHRVITTRQSTVPEEGYISRIWSVGPGDPSGRHRIVVTLGGGRVETFEFELVDP